MDDFLLLTESLAEGRARLGAVEAFLGERLRLALNPRRITLAPVACPRDVVGYVHFPGGRVRLRRRSARRFWERLPALEARLAAGEIAWSHARASVASWSGLARHAHAFRLSRAVFDARDRRNVGKRLLVARAASWRLAPTPSSPTTRRVFLVELPEEACDLGLELGERRMRRQSLADTVARLAVRVQHDHLARAGQSDPHDLHAAREVPPGLVAQLGLTLSGARDLRSQDRRNANVSSREGSQLIAPPHRTFGASRVLAETHASLVASDEELGMALPPGAKDHRDADRDTLLQVAARRHVEEPPVHVLHPALDAWPRDGVSRIEARRHVELDGEADGRRHLNCRGLGLPARR
jgi:hypothetical protein